MSIILDAVCVVFLHTLCSRAGYDRDRKDMSWVKIYLKQSVFIYLQLVLCTVWVLSVGCVRTLPVAGVCMRLTTQEVGWEREDKIRVNNKIWGTQILDTGDEISNRLIKTAEEIYGGFYKQKSDRKRKAKNSKKKLLRYLLCFK